MVIIDFLYDFFIKNGFALELLICAALFVPSLKRRNFFILRVLACVAVMLGISVAWSFMPEMSALTEIAKYIILFFTLFAGIMLCFETSVWFALFCLIGACATQHGAFKLGDFARYIAGDRVSELVSSILYLIITFSAYTASYFIFARRIKKNESSYFENKQLLFLGIILVLFVTLFQNIFARNTDGIVLSLYLIFSAYDFMCCIFTLCLQYGMFKSGKLEQENKFMEHFLHLQKEQFETSKENIDLINIKCHDLKKQISMLDGRITEGEISQLKRAVSIYDSSVKTGNEILDIVLAEKSLLCEKENIRLDCIADGATLSFMTPSDIYSLFGNAIDNAVEAVRKIEDPDKRIISLTAKEAMGMLSLHFENCYSGKLAFIDNLPLTTKNDKRYHGFGLKSIKILTEKYNGYFSLKAEDDIFNLNILLPVPGKYSAEI